MKNTRLAVLSIFSLLAFATACKKNSSSPNQGNTTTGKMVRILQGTDPDITNDTVYLISYDASGKITSLIDSLNLDTLAASYDASGNLTAITDKSAYPQYDMNGSFTYDGSNHLTQMDYNLAGSAERYTFDYTSGVVSKKSYYSNLGSGPLTLQNYYTYTLSGNNITDIKFYSSGGALLAEGTATYGSQANPFKTLSLFNFGDRLGLDGIAPIESFFNSNINAAVSTSGLSATANVTYDSKQQLSKIVVTDNINGDLLTWQFTFK